MSCATVSPLGPMTWSSFVGLLMGRFESTGAACLFFGVRFFMKVPGSAVDAPTPGGWVAKRAPGENTNPSAAPRRLPPYGFWLHLSNSVARLACLSMKTEATFESNCTSSNSMRATESVKLTSCSTA